MKTTTPQGGDSQGMMDLLALVTNPAAAKANLEALHKATAELQDVQKSADKAALSATTALEGAAAAQAAAEKAYGEASAQAKLNESEKALLQRAQHSLAEAQRLHKNAVAAHGAAAAKRDADLKAREVALAVKESKVDSAIAAAEATKADFLARKAALEKALA